MALEIDVLDNKKKGSNKGALGRIPGIGACYIKYCPGSANTRRTSLDAAHQPFYELVAERCAEIIGLKVPSTHLLYDGNGGHQNKEVKFLKRDFNGGRLYHVSEIIKGKRDINEDTEEEAIFHVNQDRPYLELLGIRDVLSKPDSVGITQNYVLLYDGIHYIDLGVSMGIQAQNNSMSVRRDIGQEEDIKTLAKRMERYGIRKKGSSREIINLKKLLDKFGEINISILNYRDEKRIMSINNLIEEGLIKKQEAEDLRYLLAATMHDEVNKLRQKESELLVRLDN